MRFTVRRKLLYGGKHRPWMFAFKGTNKEIVFLNISSDSDQICLFSSKREAREFIDQQDRPESYDYKIEMVVE